MDGQSLVNNKIPEYARAIAMRKADKELDNKFLKLPDIKHWEWLIFASSHDPIDSLNFARQLVDKK